MFETISAHVAALPLAVQLIGLMVLLAAADFAMAVITAVATHTFHGTMVGQWILGKGLPILTVALLYGLDAAVKIVPVNVGGTDLGAFGALAYAQAASFIAQEAFSVVKNAKALGSGSSPVDEKAQTLNTRGTAP